MANTKKDNEEKVVKKNSTQKNNKNTKSNSKSNASKNSSSKSVNNSKMQSKKDEIKEVDTIKEVEEIEVNEEIEKEKIDSKKVALIVVGLIIFFGLIFYLSTLSGKGQYQEPVSENENYDMTDVGAESSSISEDEMKDLKEISVDDYLSLKESDEKYSVIYIGRPTCSHCTVQLPIMKHMAYKYNIEINYLNTDNFDSEGKDATKLQKSDDYFSEGWGTPLVLIVKDDEIVEYSEGETSIARLTELFKKYEIISE